MNKLESRYYENEYPEVGEIVTIVYKNINDNYVTVSLPEYNNITGLMMFKDLTRKKYIHNINKLVKMDKYDVALVTIMDKNKNYINLSKIDLTEEEIDEFKEYYKKNRKIDNIMRNVAVRTNSGNLEDIYRQLIWEKELVDPYDDFEEMNMRNSFEEYYPELENTDTLEILKKEIKSKFKKKKITVSKPLKLICYDEDGIKTIKDFLKTMINNDKQIKIRYECGYYKLSIETESMELGESLLNDFLLKLEKEISSRKEYKNIMIL